jgi:hypothetical protein
MCHSEGQMFDPRNLSLLSHSKTTERFLVVRRGGLFGMTIELDFRQLSDGRKRCLAAASEFFERSVGR